MTVAVSSAFANRIFAFIPLHPIQSIHLKIGGSPA